MSECIRLLAWEIVSIVLSQSLVLLANVYAELKSAFRKQTGDGVVSQSREPMCERDCKVEKAVHG